MRKGNRVLLLSDTWATFALGLIGPVYAIFVEKIGGGAVEASWAYSSFMITSGIVMYFMGKWEDRIKRKEKLIVGGYLLTSLGALFYIFVYNQITLVITQIILGLAEALLVPAFDALYSDLLCKKERASGWGIEESMIKIVTATAAIIGGYTVDIYGFRTLFIIMFIASLFSFFSSLRLLGKNKKLTAK